MFLISRSPNRSRLAVKLMPAGRPSHWTLSVLGLTGVRPVTERMLGTLCGPFGAWHRPFTIAHRKTECALWKVRQGSGSMARGPAMSAMGQKRLSRIGKRSFLFSPGREELELVCIADPTKRWNLCTPDLRTKSAKSGALENSTLNREQHAAPRPLRCGGNQRKRRRTADLRSLVE
jgi:hypothetical protein